MLYIMKTLYKLTNIFIIFFQLQIFSNQISSTVMEFSMCDLFSINARLFTSVSEYNM
jgi:hypothetical protein